MATALVTGAGRGVGRGIAEGLAEAGHRVYFTARDARRLKDLSAAIGELGGTARPVLFDHASTDELPGLFEKIANEAGRLDLLVNNVWGGYENMVEDGEFTWATPFWKQPFWRWDAMMTVGVKTAYAASRLAAPLMLAQQSGLIVNMSYWSARKYIANVVYGMAKAATDKMTADMGEELRNTGASVLSLYPGLVRTEKVMANADYLDLTNSESPRYIGRVIAALMQSDALSEFSGKICIAAELGRRFGVVDVDGRSPVPLSLETA